MNATVEQLAPVEQPATTTWVVAALYQFKEVADPADLQQRLLNLVNSINLCGTLIVAGEGIKGNYRDWETDRKSTRLNSSHSAKPRMPSSA